MLLSLCHAPVHARGRGIAVVMSGASCPDVGLARQLDTSLGALDKLVVPVEQTAAAVARARATRALNEARRLYTRTNFAGCISLLSISELELARVLADPDPALQQRTHKLLAEILLWLGICQWAAGEPQIASTSFVLSNQLPTSPTPDPRLLPPELVQAYRTAIASPRQQITCRLDPPLRVEHLLVDGKGPAVTRGNGDKQIVFSAGSHYLVMRVACTGEDDRCRSLKRQLGPRGMRSLRLAVTSERCRIQVPVKRPPARIICINPAEATMAPFVAAVTEEARTSGTLVIDVSSGKVALRLHRAGSGAFHHQLVSNLRAGETPAQVVARSTALLLGERSRRPKPLPPPPALPWYKRWWVWALVGTAVVTVTTTAVVATSSDRVKVVFGP